jgi:hypothetical protein
LFEVFLDIGETPLAADPMSAFMEVTQPSRFDYTVALDSPLASFHAGRRACTPIAR